MSYSRRQSLAEPKVKLAGELKRRASKRSAIQGHQNHRFSYRDKTSLSRHISLCLIFVKCCKSGLVDPLKGSRNFHLRSVLVYTTCKYLEEIKDLKDFAKPTFYYNYNVNYNKKSFT
jgi:hypothetical protein